MASKKTSRSAVTVKDVPAAAFVKTYAAHLKKTSKIQLPAWVDIVKTGTHKELAPYDPNWFYVRAAAVARKVYLRNGLGLGDFRKIYGGGKHRGPRGVVFTKGSGSVARHVLKQLEKIGVVEKDPKGGRRITSAGQRDLDRIAGRVATAAAKQQ